MRYRPLAGTRLLLSVVGIGGNVFGHFLDRKQSEHLIARAADLGINLVDTADVYNDGLSEEYIGGALAGTRGHWIIATKAGLRSQGDPRGLAAPASLREKLNGSLKRLKVEYIDLYQLHHFDPVTPLELTVETLAEFRRQGKIRYAGVSNYSRNAIEAIVSASHAIDPELLVSVQCHHNVLVQDNLRDLFPTCGKYGLAVLAYGVLARGLLSGKYAHEVPEGSRASCSASVRADLTPAVQRCLAQMKWLAVHEGIPMAHLAMRWALTAPQVASALVGFRNLVQLEQVARFACVEIRAEVLAECATLPSLQDASQSAPLGRSVVFG